MAQTKLKRLFHEIAQTDSTQALRSRFIDTIGSHFQSQRWGIYLYSPQGQLNSVDIHGIRNVEAFVETYQSSGKAVDPVLQYIETYHTPAHEGMFYKAQKEWKCSPLYTRCCASLHHTHFMTGPIVGQGQMAGAVYFSRTSGPAFHHQNLTELGALCSHLSAQLATFKATPTLNPARVQPLTARELQIAELVAAGLTNAEISQQLWITENTVKQALKKIFRKLKVANRAAMVAQLLS